MTTQGGPTCLLLEYVPHGTLEDFLTSLYEGPIPDWYIRFTRDTLRGAYHKHVSGDLMSIIVQVADGMVKDHLVIQPLTLMLLCLLLHLELLDKARNDTS